MRKSRGMRVREKRRGEKNYFSQPPRRQQRTSATRERARERERGSERETESALPLRIRCVANERVKRNAAQIKNGEPWKEMAC